MKSQIEGMEANKESDDFDMKALDDLNDELKTAEENKTTLENEHKDLQTNAEKLDKDLEEFDAKAQTLTSENETLNTELTQVEADIQKAQAQQEADEILAPFKEIFDGLKGDSTDELTPEMVEELKGKMEALQAKYPNMDIYSESGYLEVMNKLSDGNLAMVKVSAGENEDEMFFGQTDYTDFGKLKSEYIGKWESATEGLSEKEKVKVSKQIWTEFEQKCKDKGIDPETARESVTFGKFANYAFSQDGDENSGSNFSIISTDIDNHVTNKTKSRMWNR